MALDYQILLLPHADYWTWLSACREYVQTFGANLTPDPEVAARHMRPSQVVTFPVFEGAYPDLGDPIRWFHKNHEGIRIDPIAAASPKRLAKELKQRVRDNDRYGARRRPFHLLWPTDYPVITQPFGANPQIYRRYGMPGHEGVDLRALTNTHVYACADGEVYEVVPYPRPHPYGIHVRVRHRDGYRTVYAHLARVLVSEGEPVRAGQLIGRADSTGNSSASHLHLSLKRDGATARGETTYPKDILDPTPFLVWPAPGQSKAAAEPSRGRGFGLNLVRAEELTRDEIEWVTGSAAEVALISHTASRQTVESLRAAAAGDLRVVVRVVETPASGERPARFLARIAGEVGRLYRTGIRDFEVASFPNEHRGGLGRTWVSGETFAEWFLELVGLLKSVFPEGRFGWPSLAEGGDVTGRQQAAESFLSQAAAAVDQAPWIAVACSWPNAARTIHAYRSAYPGTPILVTDLDMTASGPASETAAIRLVELYRGLEAGRGEVTLFFDIPEKGSKEEAPSLTWETLRILAERKPTGRGPRA